MMNRLLNQTGAVTLTLVDGEKDGKRQKLVDLSSLHQALEIKSDFTDWAKRSLVDVGEDDCRPVDGVVERAGRGPVTKHVYLVTMETAKLIAARSRSAASMRVYTALDQLTIEKALANQQLTAVSTAVQEVVTTEQPMFLSDQFEAYLTLVESEKDGKRQKLVDLSSLHQALEIKSDFTHWAKRSLEDVGEDHHVVDDVVERPQGGTTVKHVYLVTMETAKLIAARSRSAASLRICKWLVAVEEEARRRVEAELEVARAAPPKERLITSIEVARSLLTALEAQQAAEIEAATQQAIAAAATQRIASNVLIPRPQYEEATAGIPLTAIKRDIAPYLSIVVIRNILKYYGQKRTFVQFAPHENAVVKPFAREGVELAIQQFLEEAEQRISFSRKTVVLKHDCLVGDEAQVSREDAIQYLGFTAEQFED